MHKFTAPYIRAFSALVFLGSLVPLARALTPARLSPDASAEAIEKVARTKATETERTTFLTAESQNFANETGTQALPGANLSFSSKLDLATASLFVGGVKFGYGTDATGLNVAFTSSLPAAKTSTADKNRYQDAELMIPQGGVINIFFSPFTTVKTSNFGKLKAAQTRTKTSDPYGRGALSDRHYFGVDTSTPDTAAASLASDNARFYSTLGIGPRVLNRNLEGTATKDTDSYGLAGTAYAGLGMDGGFLGSEDTSMGNYRLEIYAMGNWADRTSMKAMYPGVTNPDQASGGYGATLSISINKRFQASVQYARPIGRLGRDMKDIVLVGISVVR
jgi:hypothetical protein